MDNTEDKGLNRRQELFLDKYAHYKIVDGLTRKKAAIKAHREVYSYKGRRSEDKVYHAANNLLYRINKIKSIAEHIEQFMPKDEWASRLVEKTKAKKPVVYQGEITEEVDDNVAQLGALKMIGDVGGYFQKQRSMEVNINSKKQTLIVKMDASKLDEPDRPVEDIEAEFIEEYEKEMD